MQVGAGLERRRRRRLALVPVSYFQWPLLAVVALGPGPPGLLALGRDEHEQTGPPSQVSTTLEFHVRHCQRQPHAGRTKAPSHVPDNLEHVYERAGQEEQLSVSATANSSTQEHEAAPVAQAQPCRSAEPAGSSPRFRSAVRGDRANDQAAQLRSGPTTPPD